MINKNKNNVEKKGNRFELSFFCEKLKEEIWM